MSHIFISYSRQNKDCAYKIQYQLEAQGYTVWIDKDSIPGGEQWGLEIQKGVQNAHAALILWSKEAAESEYVAKEITYALNKRTTDDILVIPVLLNAFDHAPLRDNLKGLNAIPMQSCNRQQIQHLIQHLHALPKRQVHTLDHVQTFGDIGTTIAGSDWVSVPLIESVHTQAHLIADPHLTKQDVLAQTQPTVQLCLEFRGQPTDYQFIEGVADHVADEEAIFCAIRITPNPINNLYTLDNHSPGQWLDAVNTAYAAVNDTFGRGKATVQVFSLAPAVLTMALGTKFYEYWRLQLYNFIKPGYVCVLDTDNL
jgi:hypothetical protein